ncbi:MAG: VanZ family protein [Chloroflexota bacterium]
MINLPRWLRDGVPVLIWMAFIFSLSSQPRLADIEDPTLERIFFKSAHIIAYGLLAWLSWRALTADRSTTWSVLLLAFFLSTLYGISDEIHQRFVPGRHGRVADVLFDASGALGMILLLRRVKWLRDFPEYINLVKSRMVNESFDP